MPTPLFSTYRQGENRVTATFLAVLERLSLPTIDRILGALLGDSEFGLVTFQNQVKGEQRVLDALIRTTPAIGIETKIQSGAVGDEQIRGHLHDIRKVDPKGILLVLTPDDRAPWKHGSFPSTEQAQPIWSNFANLADAVKEILENKEDPPFEAETFLLRELIAMLEKERLIGLSVKPQVMVIAAGIWGWPMYKELNVYRCAVGRRMRPLTPGIDHVAFYADGHIQRPLPKVKSVIEEIDIAEPDWTRIQDDQHLDKAALDTAKAYVAELKCNLKNEIENLQHEFVGPFKLVFLSGPDDKETVQLKNLIENDKKDLNGKGIGFTQGTRYVSLEILQTVGESNDPKTSELERLLKEQS